MHSSPDPSDVAAAATSRKASTVVTPDSLTYDAQGLVAAIIQDDANDEVLMLGWMDSTAVQRTLTEGRVTFYSRSRKEYWRKGDTSGHRQWVRSVRVDCDADALLIRVTQEGAACHNGTRTCFMGEMTAHQGAPMENPA